jgi:hypothetical protein
MSGPCPDCEASSQWLHHGFSASCAGCQARMLSRSPDFSQSRRNGSQTSRYVAALAAAGLTHDQVKAAAAADRTQP